MNRVIVWFSCGAASAAAAKLANLEYGPELRIVYCDTSASEHPDNIRFYKDCAKWVGHPFEAIGSKLYASIDEVFERERYMSGIKGARCTVEMKKIPRFDYQQPDDVHIFGITADEQKRIADLEENNPELRFRWILRDHGMTKEKCLRMVAEAGIRLPTMYILGFEHNNCIGCVKATSPDYWNKVRFHFPEVFERRARQSRELGVRLTRLNGERIFLDELPEGAQELITEDISCGPQC